MLDAYWQVLVHLAQVCSGCEWDEGVSFFSFIYKEQKHKKKYFGQFVVDILLVLLSIFGYHAYMLFLVYVSGSSHLTRSIYYLKRIM